MLNLSSMDDIGNDGKLPMQREERCPKDCIWYKIYAVFSVCNFDPEIDCVGGAWSSDWRDCKGPHWKSSIQGLCKRGVLFIKCYSQVSEMLVFDGQLKDVCKISSLRKFNVLTSQI